MRKDLHSGTSKEYYSKNRDHLLNYRNNYYHNNKERTKELKKLWRINNPEKYLLANARGSAKQRGLVFNLTIEDVIIPESCPILGIPLRLASASDNSPSIDRLDSSKGYVKGNVHVVSWRANDLKANGTLDEFRRLVTWMTNAEMANELQEEAS